MRESGGDVTVLVRKWRGGDSSALEELVPHIYDEMRKLARAHLSRERSNHTLQPTALVHEVYMRMAGGSMPPIEGRRQFYSIAARLMRQVLVDHARAKSRSKRGSGAETVVFDESMGAGVQPVEITALDEALTRLEAADPRKARVIELRYFGGLTVDEAAAVLGISAMTVHRDLQFATAWLSQQLKLQRPS